MLVKTSLLNQIKSKFILQYVLLFAYSDMDSVLKLIKYNKELLNKLSINMADYYKYRIKTKIRKEKNSKQFGIISLVFDIIIFILFFAYIITFYVRGAFNDENLKEGYNIKNKKFVDFMNKYILLLYLGFSIISIFIKIIFFITNKFLLKGYEKVIINLVIYLIEILHFIFYVIKTHYTRFLVKPELKTQYDKEFNQTLYVCSNKIWFYSFDISLAFFISYFKLALFLLAYPVVLILSFKEFNDIKIQILQEINGININDFELPEKFEGSNNKKNYELIFKKQNIKEYKYQLKINEIDIIQQINDIRKKKNIPELKFYKNEKLPDFIINKKTEIILFPNKNIYKLSLYCYIFKFQKNDFLNFITKKEIISIINIDLLDKINIIEKDEFYYISIYNSEHKIPKNISNNDKNNNNIPNIKQLPDKNICNTDDKIINTESENLDVTELSNEINNETKIVKNIKIKNMFSK